MDELSVSVLFQRVKKWCVRVTDIEDDQPQWLGRAAVITRHLHVGGFDESLPRLHDTLAIR